MKKINKSLFYLAIFSILFLNGCRTISPPAEVAVKKLSSVTPIKASKLLVVIPLNLELSKPIKSNNVIGKSYIDFAEDLEKELNNHGVEAEVITSVDRVPVIDQEKKYDHIGILTLQSMYSSVSYGNRSRVWELKVQQRDSTQERVLATLQSTVFVSDFVGCYLFQVTVADNKAECRTKIVEFIIEQFKLSGVVV
jgi:hypothetical protein